MFCVSKIFNFQSKTITRAAILLLFFGLVSKLLALVRDRLLAGRFGAGQELDIYFAAFRIPDFVFGIMIMGGLATVFLPVFSEYFKKSEEDGWKLANNALNCFLILLIATCALLAVFTPYLIKFIIPGFNQESRDLAISLTRIMFLSPIFLGISSIFSGILHYFNKFLIYSLAPVLYNLGIIIGILFFVPAFGLKGLAFGVILGAILHWIIQIPATKFSGYRYSFIFNFRHPGLVKIFKLVIPRTIGSAAYHINLIVVTAIASTLTVGSIAVLNFSNNLQYLPVGLIGLSFALASFPALSKAWVDKAKEKFLESFSLVFRQVLFLMIPTSVLVFLLRAQFVRLILGTGQFGWLETRLTAASLGLFCFGIFAISLIPLLARTFYSLHDTKTPVFIGLASVSLNIALSFIFINLLEKMGVFYNFTSNILRLEGIKNISIVGLPLALSISGIFQFSLLVIFLKIKMGDIRLKKILQSFWKILLSSILLGVFTYFSLRFASGFVNMNTFSGVFVQTIFGGTIGVLVYIFSSFFFGSPEMISLLRKFSKNNNGRTEHS